MAGPADRGQGAEPPHQQVAPTPAARAGSSGTVYRAQEDYRPAPPEPAHLDDTGSLTGYILARGVGGGPEEPSSPRFRGVVIAAVILLGIGVTVAVGLLAVNTMFASLLDG